MTTPNDPAKATFEQLVERLVERGHKFTGGSADTDTAVLDVCDCYKTDDDGAWEYTLRLLGQEVVAVAAFHEGERRWPVVMDDLAEGIERWLDECMDADWTGEQHPMCIPASCANHLPSSGGIDSLLAQLNEGDHEMTSACKPPEIMKIINYQTEYRKMLKYRNARKCRNRLLNGLKAGRTDTKYDLAAIRMRLKQCFCSFPFTLDENGEFEADYSAYDDPDYYDAVEMVGRYEAKILDWLCNPGERHRPVCWQSLVARLALNIEDGCVNLSVNTLGAFGTPWLSFRFPLADPNSLDRLAATLEKYHSPINLEAI